MMSVDEWLVKVMTSRLPEQTKRLALRALPSLLRQPPCGDALVVSEEAVERLAQSRVD